MANLEMKDRVTLENLNTWELHFRGIEGQRDIVVPPAVKNWRYLDLAEVDAQVKSNNGFFCGTDGYGKNASIKIVDDDVRRYVFGIPEDEPIKPQEVLDLDAIKELLATTPKAAFMKKLEEMVVTDAEKRRLVMLSKYAGIDDVERYKAKAIEELVKTKVE